MRAHGAVAVLLVFGLALGCGKKKSSDPAVIPQDTLVLELMGPPDGTDPRATVCADPNSGNPPAAWLVTVTAPFEIDSARNASGGWDESTLLFVFDDELVRNCAQNPCGREWIPRIDGTPSFVRVEGARQDPDFVGNDNENWDVLCVGETQAFPRDFRSESCFPTDQAACDAARGGTINGAAQISMDGGYPPLLPEQDPVYRSVYNAHVRMVGVDISQPIYTSDPTISTEPVPWLAYTGVGALSDGRVLITGGARDAGLAESSAYVFDSEAIGVTRVLGMQGGRRAAHAMLPLDSTMTGGPEIIALIGGSNTIDPSLAGVDLPLASVVYFDMLLDDFAPGPTLSAPVALPTVAAYPAIAHNRILVSGGYTTSSLTAFGAGAGVSDTADIIRLDSITFVATVTSTAGRAGAEAITNLDGTRAFVIGGFSVNAPADVVNCTDNSATNRLVDCSDEFNPATLPEGDFEVAAVASPAAAHMSHGRIELPGIAGVQGVVVTGGVSDRDGVSGEVLTDQVYFYTNAFVGQGLLTMPEVRGRHATVRLPDGRMLMLGGGRRDLTGALTDITDTTAIYDPAGFNPGGGMLGAFACDNDTGNGVLPDCPVLLAPRVAHGAAMITGGGFLDHAILIAGGASGGLVVGGQGPDTAVDASVELFYPSFGCVNDGNGDFIPPDGINGSVGRCERNKRVNDDGDIYRNGPEQPE